MAEATLSLDTSRIAQEAGDLCKEIESFAERISPRLHRLGLKVEFSVETFREPDIRIERGEDGSFFAVLE